METHAESLQESLSKSLSMVVLSEIGDKTFFIAALLAMRHGRSKVFVGSWGALAVMTFLSTAMGWAAPQLIPDYIVLWGAVALFFAFGFRMLYQAVFWEEPEVSELDEVEAELKHHNGIVSEELNGHADDQSMQSSPTDSSQGSPQKNTITCSATGNGMGIAGPLLARRRTGKSSTSAEQEGAHHDLISGGNLQKSAPSSWSSAARSAIASLVPPIVLESFLLTFLAEWGDRSQLATIGLAMAGNAYGVCAGGMLGHAVCTGVAVIGGKRLANHINERMIVGAGACLFIIFGARAVAEELY